MSLQRYPIRTAGEHGPKAGLRFETPAREADPPQIRPECFTHIQKPVIKMFTVYEHDLNRNRARLMQEELTNRLGRSFDFSVTWWSLKSLWHPKMLRVAADAVAQADIMLFALLSGGELPQSLTKWIEARLLHNTKHRVSLLALLETGGMIAPRLSSAEIYLSHLATKAGVDCLCYSDGIPLTRTNWPRKVRLSVGEALKRLL